MSTHAATRCGRALAWLRRTTTNQKNYLSSDYFLKRLQLDPERQLKRYGDGFAEQQLINEQVLALTQRRTLDGYADAQDQYRALMDAGVAFAQQYHLAPGVALSAQQMALLTTDIVWLVAQDVRLPDGSTQKLLVPQVYLRRAQDGDLQANGSLIAARQVIITSQDSLANSGTIAADGVFIQAGADLLNTGRIQGQTVVAQAQRDLQLIGGRIQGQGSDSSVALNAGRDLLLQTTTQTTQAATPQSQSQRTAVDRIATVQGGNISLQAGRDLLAQGAQVSAGANLIAQADGRIVLSSVQTHFARDIASGGDFKGSSGFIRESGTAHQASSFSAGSDLAVIAGKDLSIQGAEIQAARNALLAGAGVDIQADVNTATTHTRHAQADSLVQAMHSSQSLSGATVQAGNHLTIQATQGDLTARAAQLSAGQGQVSLVAHGNVSLSALSTQHASLLQVQDEDRSALGSKASSSIDRSQATQRVGSAVSGQAVLIQAGQSGQGDIRIEASTVVAEQALQMQAAGDLTITSLTQTSRSTSQAEQQQSGLFASGAGITLGSQSAARQNRQTITEQVGSQVGSLSGDVSLTAGGHYQQTASSVTAVTGDVTIAAQSVGIEAATQSASAHSAQQMRQGGLSIGLSSPLLQAAQSVQQMGEAAGQTQDSRIQALAAASAAMSAVNAVNATQQAVAQGDATGGVTLSISIGASRSQSRQDTQNTVAVGSTVAAGGKVSITASGAGNDSNLILTGSNLSAGGDVTLKADNAIQLQAAQNTTDFNSQSSSSSASVGVGLSAGTGGIAGGVTVSAAASQGKASGSELTHSNTHVSAGGTLNLQSGGDTTLNGAVASAEQVKADIGGDLIIHSLQDQAQYASKDQNAGGSLTIGAGVSGNVNYGQAKVNADYQSVTEQSAIRAGDGGFQINVKGHTDLVGAAITSSQAAVDQNKNTLSTATLTATELHNKEQYSANAVSLSVGSSGSSAGIGHAGGDQSSTTASAISVAAVSVTSGNDQALAQIDRSAVTDEANTGSLSKTWDGQQLSADVQAQTQITTAFGAQAAKAIGDIAGAKAEQARKDAEQARQAGDEQSAQEFEATAQKWDEGGAYRVAAHAAAGALTGGLSGAVGAAVSAAAVPEIAQAVDKLKLPEPVRDALVTAAGAAVGVVGGADGAAAGLNQTANNYLKHEEQVQRFKADQQCRSGDAQACRTRDALDALSQQRQADLVDVCLDGGAADCRQANATVAADYVGLMVYGAELDKLIANNTDPAVAQHLKTLKSQSDQHLAQAAAIVKTNLSELQDNKGGLGSTEQALLWSLNAQSSGEGIAALMGAGLVGQDRIGKLVPGGPRELPAPKGEPSPAGDKGQSFAEPKQLPKPVDASADSPYNSTGRPYDEKTLTDDKGNPVPTGTNAQSVLNDLASKKADKITAPVDFDHVIGADYKRNANGTLQLDANGNPKPNGGHSLVNGDVRVVPGSESVPDSSGVYKARVEMPDPMNPGQWVPKETPVQTMFPKEWTADRIKFEIDAAWNSPQKTIIGSQWFATTPSGIMIKGYLSPRVTAYPIFTGP
jgi:filamentous hemagglutinin